MELLLRNEKKAYDTSYDIKKIKKMLEDDYNPLKIVETAEPIVKKPEPPKVAEAPAPTPKVETVKVLFATADIAPNTTITTDLIVEKFTVKEMPKGFADGAVADLTPKVGKALKMGVANGMYVTEGMIGTATPKAGPHDSEITSLPKPGETTVTKPQPVKPAARKTRDVSVHTTSGSQVYRYEEVRPDEWKLLKVLTQEEAAVADAKKTD
jgi:hypothetical protein